MTRTSSRTPRAANTARIFPPACASAGLTPSHEAKNWLYVNEYEVQRAYGGPEEGGWWYDRGTFIVCLGEADSPEMAEHIREAFIPQLNEVNAGLPLYVRSGANRRIIFIEDEPGADFPTRPQGYE